MRTNIVLNDRLLAEARRYSRAGTKRGIVEEALEVFVETRAAERRRANYRTRVEQLRPKLDAIDLPESSRDVIRADRDRR